MGDQAAFDSFSAARLTRPDSGANDSASLVYGYRRLKIQKVANGGDVFRVDSIVSSPDSQFRFPPQQFRPKLRRTIDDAGALTERDVDAMPADLRDRLLDAFGERDV